MSTGESEATTAAEIPVRNGRLRALVFGVVPVMVVLLGALAGVLSWQEWSHRGAAAAAVDSVAAARDVTATILSYHADTADRELNDARRMLTSPFLEEYTKLINDVVIPGARQKKISASAEIPAATSILVTPDHAVALVFVDQTTTIGDDAPTRTASSVRVTLNKVDGRWLLSGFDPV